MDQESMEIGLLVVKAIFYTVAIMWFYLLGEVIRRACKKYLGEGN